MARMNKVMLEKLRYLDWRNKTLPLQLFEISKPGFDETVEGVFLTTLRKKNSNVSEDNFPDKTGHECFVNSIHIDDFVESDYLVYACLFAEDCLSRWRQSHNSSVMRCIISSDEYGSTVKFHLLRENEQWIDSDLEGYAEAILVIDSSESEGVKNLTVHLNH